VILIVCVPLCLRAPGEGQGARTEARNDSVSISVKLYRYVWSLVGLWILDTAVLDRWTLEPGLCGASKKWNAPPNGVSTGYSSQPTEYLHCVDYCGKVGTGIEARRSSAGRGPRTGRPRRPLIALDAVERRHFLVRAPPHRSHWSLHRILHSVHRSPHTRTAAQRRS
jgi:hypothetical protein